MDEFKLTEFTFHLILLFFPGIICALIVEKLVTAQEWSNFRFALYSFVLGLVSYLAYAVSLALLACEWPPDVSLFRALVNSQQAPPAISYEEILIVAGFFAPLVSFVVALVLNRHWLNRFAKKVKVGKRFGDSDVWSFTFNSSDLTDDWIVVRDFERDLAFEGWVNAFAETAEANELLLRDVKVYRSTTSELLYEINSLYVTRKKDDLTIEFRKGGDDRRKEES